MANDVGHFWPPTSKVSWLLTTSFLALAGPGVVGALPPLAISSMACSGVVSTFVLALYLLEEGIGLCLRC